MEVGQARGEMVRWAVLTSGPDSPLDIRGSFRAFVKRVRRLHGSFEYFVTAEYHKNGRLHLNVLWRGPYLDQAWVSQQWAELHRSPIVYVTAVVNPGGVARYVTKQLTEYVLKSLARRIWYSRGWTGPNAGVVYRGLREQLGRQWLRSWWLFLAGMPTRIGDTWHTVDGRSGPAWEGGAPQAGTLEKYAS